MLERSGNLLVLEWVLELGLGMVCCSMEVEVVLMLSCRMDMEEALELELVMECCNMDMEVVKLEMELEL